MHDDVIDFVEASCDRYKHEYFQLRSTPSLSQVLSGGNLSYLYIVDATPEPEEVFQRCLSAKKIHLGYFAVKRQVPDTDHWKKGQTKVIDVTIRVFASNMSELMQFAYSWLRLESENFPAKSEPDGL